MHNGRTDQIGGSRSWLLAMSTSNVLSRHRERPLGCAGVIAPVMLLIRVNGPLHCLTLSDPRLYAV